MNDFTVLLVGAIIGFIAGIAAMGKSCETDTALQLSNVMNASMLECVTNKVITKEQVHDWLLRTKGSLNSQFLHFEFALKDRLIFLFGSMSLITRIIYTLVGISGLWGFKLIFDRNS